MPSFARPETQASKAADRLSGIGQAQGSVESARTLRSYEQSLRGVASWLQEQREGRLRDLTRDQAERYLSERAEQVGQKTLDQDRQAIQAHIGERIERIESERAQAVEVRAVSDEQYSAIRDQLSDRAQVAADVVREAGLRAHEVYTIRPIAEREPHDRAWGVATHDAHGGERYTVEGKGGLVREVKLSSETAERLEQYRLEQTQSVTDRAVHYESAYALPGGQALSQAWSRAAQTAIGESTGLHGLRHSYAQDRMEALQRAGYSYTEALAGVASEMGHLRGEITEVYLR